MFETAMPYDERLAPKPRCKGDSSVQTEFSTTYERAFGTLTVRVCAATNVGRVRQVNEDSYFAKSPVFFVADGMGGHAYGDRASQTVAATFDEHIDADAPMRPEEILGLIDESNESIQRLITEQDGPGAVAGTTLSGIGLVDVDEITPDGDELHWMIFNIGDSRVYGWNGRSLIQVTIDHSAVQEMVSMGLITPADALIHPDRNVITRAVGSERHVETDIWLMPTRGHQVFVMCSDGLTKELSDEQIADIMLAYSVDENPTETLAQTLVDEAVRAGGRDNVTVVVVDSTITRSYASTADEDTQPRPASTRAHSPEMGLSADQEDTTPRITE